LLSLNSTYYLAGYNKTVFSCMFDACVCARARAMPASAFCVCVYDTLARVCAFVRV
jgi:hypothetical protein